MTIGTATIYDWLIETTHEAFELTQSENGELEEIKINEISQLQLSFLTKPSSIQTLINNTNKEFLSYHPEILTPPPRPV